MQKLIIRTNTRTRECFDENGISFRNGTPEISIGSKFLLEWYLYSETPDADTETPDITAWIPDTSMDGYTAVVTADDDWLHSIKGTLSASIAENAAFPQMLQVNIPDAKNKNISKTGKVTLCNASREYQTILYNDILVNGDSVYVQVEGVAKYPFESDDIANVSQETYIRAYNIAELSDPQNGKFVFEIYTNSTKLIQATQNLNSQTLSIKGIELMPFKVESESHEYIQAPAYLLDSAILVSTIGDVFIGGEINNPVKSEIDAYIDEKLKGFSPGGGGEGGSNQAVDIKITDSGNHFIATNVEGALAELAEKIGNVETVLAEI